jgi:hypothetical protein
MLHYGGKAGRHAESSGLKLVGYYQACERLDDTALAPVGEKVAGKIKQGFKDAVAFVVCPIASLHTCLL